MIFLPLGESLPGRRVDREFVPKPTPAATGGCDEGKELSMTEHTSSQARDGLMSSLTGKAKEVAGAVTGNDSLTAEGQLQQTEAKARKEANAQDAVAQAEQTEALQKLAAERQAATSERQAAAGAAGIARARAEQDAAAQQRAAELAAERDKRVGQMAAEHKTADRVSDARADAALTMQEAHRLEQEAGSAHEAAQASADTAEQAAERAREDARQLDHDAGLA